MSIYKKRFFGSLSSRIVLIFIFLVILPIMAFTILLWKQDAHLRRHAVHNEFRNQIRDHELRFQQWISEQKLSLENIEYLHRNQPLGGIKGYTSIFVFNKNLRCTNSSRKPMIGMQNFFPERLKKTWNEGDLIFLDRNPITKDDEVFFFHRIGSEIWGISLDPDVFLKLFTRFDDLSMIAPDGKLLFSFRKLQNPSVYTFKALIHERIDISEGGIAVRFPLKPLEFDLQVTLSAKEIGKIQGIPLLRKSVVFLLILIVLGVSIAWWLIYRMSQPLENLTRVMAEVAKGKHSARYRPSRFGFDINVLGQNFNQMIESLIKNMEEAKNQRVARELLSKELKIGRSIQNELFPTKLPEFPNLEIGAGFLPAKEVGGDFYDLYPKDEDHLLLSIADGSGKGISACLYSLIVRSIMRSRFLTEERLDAMLNQTNALFCQDTGVSGNFVTSFVGIYDLTKEQLTYANAGHLPALLVKSDGKIEELTTKGIALGVDKNEKIEMKRVPLKRGSLLFLFTDGIVEAQNQTGEFFGKTRLIDFLTRHAEEPIQSLIDSLIVEIETFAKQALQHDDITVLGIRPK